MSGSELRVGIAVLLCRLDRLTTGQAARFAQMDRLRFRRLLASRGIELRYDVADFAADLRTRKDLGRL